jgi:hypothetical protein
MPFKENIILSVISDLLHLGLAAIHRIILAKEQGHLLNWLIIGFVVLSYLSLHAIIVSHIRHDRMGLSQLKQSMLQNRGYFRKEKFTFRSIAALPISDCPYLPFIVWWMLVWHQESLYICRAV